MRRPKVTVALLRELLACTKSTSPYYDGVTYDILASLSDKMLAVIVEVIESCFSTGDPSGIPKPDFLALRKKFPH